MSINILPILLQQSAQLNNVMNKKYSTINIFTILCFLMTYFLKVKGRVNLIIFVFNSALFCLQCNQEN